MCRMMRGLSRFAGLGMIAAGCTAAPAPPPATGGGGAAQPPVPTTQPQSEFQPSHHALLQGVVTGRAGQALDSVTVVAWRLAEGDGSLAQTRVETDAAGRFRLPLQATIGPGPAVQARVVVRGFAYASRYPRGPGGSAAMDSVSVPVTLVPRAQAPPAVQTRITLPLP